MPDPLPHYYQPDVGIAFRTGRKPDPMTTVDKPIAMKTRMAVQQRRPNTKSKHYKRKAKTFFSLHETKRVFF